jgi:hypothetical protein
MFVLLIPASFLVSSTAAIIGYLTAASEHSLQSKLSFALLMASLIIGTY